MLRVLLVSFSLCFQLTVFAADLFPKMPDSSLTPGSLCQKPSQYRYPERIAYCTRSVSSSLKKTIMETYDSVLGYQVTKMNRGEFKIDHYIPLCMGGSNEADNLWPQHSSIYIFTDRLEEELCKKMASGDLLQAEAVRLIKEAKANVAQCQQLLVSLIGHSIH